MGIKKRRIKRYPTHTIVTEIAVRLKSNHCVVKAIPMTTCRRNLMMSEPQSQKSHRIADEELRIRDVDRQMNAIHPRNQMDSNDDSNDILKYCRRHNDTNTK
eukprot:1092855_1